MRLWKLLKDDNKDSERLERPRVNNNNNTDLRWLIYELMETRLWSAAEEREEVDMEEEIKNDWTLAAAVIDCILFTTFSFLFVGSTSLFCMVFLLFPWLWTTTVSFQQHEEVQCAYVGLRPVHRLIRSSPNLNVAIHCFGTMLKVEGLEKRLGLGLARSRSRLMAKIRRVSCNCRKVSVSVSSRTKNRMSQSRKLRSRLHPCHEYPDFER